MPSVDYIPRQDVKFLEWAQKLLIYVKAHLIAWGLSADILTPLEAKLDAYANAYGKAQDPNRGKVDVLLKNETRDSLKQSVRLFVKEHLMYNSAITNEDRENMGLPIHDTKPSPPHIPTNMPIGEVDFSTHQRHVIHVKDGKLTGRAKPPYAHAFEVWYKIGGGAPVSDSEWSYANTSTRSPLVINYSLSDVGKTVYYRFRWLNTRNQPGPWNENIVSAIIA
jgi:hypothetical protein